jgi:hypothetical protein
MPMKPLKARNVAAEGLKALAANRPVIIPGRVNRLMRGILPASFTRSMLAKMFEKLPVIANSGQQTRT